MVRLLIVADDFTGALDTGVQLAKKGAATCVITDSKLDLSGISDEIEVVSMDAETRHLSPDEAYKTVSAIVKKAKDYGVKYIYKKTDSALRGNIGAELAAMCDAGDGYVHFAPAYPAIHRTTVDGMHYIDGIPVSESVFGQDPFEPVTSSSVEDILREQTDKHMKHVSSDMPVGSSENQTIYVYDAENDARLSEIAKQLHASDTLMYCAGCAGMAAALSEEIGYNKSISGKARHAERLMVVCGSVNPITVAQLDKAESQGYPRINLPPEEKLSEDWVRSDEAKALIPKWRKLCEDRDICILDSNDPKGTKDTIEYAKAHGLTLDDVRTHVATNMGTILKYILDDGLDAALLVTGGDTLLGFMQKIGASMLIPISEIVPGIVLSEIEYAHKTYYIISKSGGFGKDTLIEDISRILKKKEKTC